MSSAQTTQNKLLSAAEIHHALLRPAILQILRAQGYYSSTPATIETLTEVAGNYMYAIAKRAAVHASLNREDTTAPDLTDVRLALQDCGALMPERDFLSQQLSGEEDMRGVDDFIRWATGKKNQRIRKVAALGGAPVVVPEEGVEERATDYLDSLKRKHNKTDQDSKYAPTILGRGIDHGEVMVEGGNETSLSAWAQKMHETATRPPREGREGGGDEADDVDVDSRPPSSGLSSLTDGVLEMMDFE